MKRFEIAPYYKCGDDLQGHLTECNGNPSQALDSMADEMEKSAKSLRKVASILKGTSAEIDADGVFITVDNLDPKTEAALEKEDVISVQDLPDEDDEQ